MNADNEPGRPDDIENSECSASMSITVCHPQLQVESHVSDTPHDITNGLEDEPVQPQLMLYFQSIAVNHLALSGSRSISGWNIQ